MTPAEKINEQAASRAFDKQSAVFDKIYASNIIIQYKRKRVRDHVLQYLHPGSRILELNAGTGEDATWFAREGHTVHATDISVGMQKILREKIIQNDLGEKVTTELCSFTALDTLKNKGPYDLIFSNFAGLNCTGDLRSVLLSFESLLKPGGLVTLVILPKFCLWEAMLMFRGKFKTAFRRFFSGRGRKAHIEGEYFTCWYYNPSFITGVLKNSFDVLGLEGLCTLVPPSYLDNFPFKRPGLYHQLVRLEEKWKRRWPWKGIGDYFIMTLRKKTLPAG